MWAHLVGGDINKICATKLDHTSHVTVSVFDDVFVRRDLLGEKYEIDVEQAEKFSQFYPHYSKLPRQTQQ